MAPPAIFRLIEQAGGIELPEMLRTFNYGIGMVVVTEQGRGNAMIRRLEEMGESAFPIGTVLAAEDRQPRVTWT